MNLKTSRTASQCILSLLKHNIETELIFKNKFIYFSQIDVLSKFYDM